MQKEIGSNFWIDTIPELEKYDILDFFPEKLKYNDYVLCSTARSALKYVVNQADLEYKKVLIPVFTCGTVIEPFVESHCKIIFYGICRDLDIDYCDLREKIESYHPDAILFHRYFGMDSLSFESKCVLNEVKKLGIVLIEDLTQTLYSCLDYINVDYYVGSLRKWGPLPDGAFALSCNDVFYNKPNRENLELVDKKIIAFEDKYKYLFEEIGDKASYMKELRIAEDYLNEQKDFYAMSMTSKCIQSNFDIEYLRQKRRCNYNFLKAKLDSVKDIQLIFGECSNIVCPLYLSLYVGDDRGKLQQYLAKHDIYAPIIWKKSKFLNGDELEFRDASYIYDHILCIPVDQRYDFDDMMRISNQIINFYQGE